MHFKEKKTCPLTFFKKVKKILTDPDLSYVTTFPEYVSVSLVRWKSDNLKKKENVSWLDDWVINLFLFQTFYFKSNSSEIYIS